MDIDLLYDYVVVHGLGEPTSEAYRIASSLYEIYGDDYATIAAEIVARDLTTEG